MSECFKIQPNPIPVGKNIILNFSLIVLTDSSSKSMRCLK